MSTLGLKVRQLRIALELTQEQAAVKVGLSVGAWRGIECYGADPRLSTLARLRTLFSVSYDVLVSDPSQLTAADLRRELKEIAKLVADDIPGSAEARDQLAAQLRLLEGGSGAPARERHQSAQLELQTPRRAGGRSGR